MKMLLLLACFHPLDTLPDHQALFANIDSFYQSQMTVELLAFQENKKGEWLKYLPTVGLSYTPEGQPRPTISWSSTLLYRSQKEKWQRKAKRKAIHRNQTLLAQAAKGKLKDLLLTYEQLQMELVIEQDLMLIEDQLLSIYQMKKDSLAMAPSEFLMKQKSFLEKKRRFRQLQSEKKKLELAILRQSFLAN